SYGGRHELPTQPSALRLTLVTPQELASHLARILSDVIAARVSDLAATDEAAAADLQAIVVTDADTQLERPKNREHGDWASNVAMKFAKRLGMNPRQLAAQVTEHLEQVDG